MFSMSLSLSLASPLRSLTLGVLLGTSLAAFSPFSNCMYCLAAVGFCAVVVGRCLFLCCFPLCARSFVGGWAPRALGWVVVVVICCRRGSCRPCLLLVVGAVASRAAECLLFIVLVLSVSASLLHHVVVSSSSSSSSITCKLKLQLMLR